MSFTQSEFLIPLLFALIILIVISLRFENTFYTWIKDHWFFKRRKRNILASILYYIGLFLVALALLDLRGPEEYITGKVSDQKTILLIDSSASMMAEDVRPNRFEKAIVLAKHYVRKAVGQQLSVSVFSDSMKRIIPFTNDVDLVDARLNALKNMKLNRGGTSLSLALQESIQYFKNVSEKGEGNILIFTDAEETDGGINLEVPKGITIGVVGVGTAKGAPVPMRNRNNTFVGNKKFKGEVVISKLDEDFLKKLGSKVKNFKYWVAGSYSLPTEDIVDFFSRIHNVKQSENSFRIRPVMQNYLMIPGVMLLALSFILKNMKTFIYIGMLFISISTYSQEEDKPKEKSAEIIKLEEKFARGEMSRNEKRLLANKLLKEGFPEQSEKLYGEILKGPISEENKKDYFNYGAAQFKSKKIGPGFNTYKKLHDYLENRVDKDDKMFKSVKDNMLKAIQSSASKSGSDGDEDEENQDKNQKGKKGKGKESKDSKNKKGKGKQQEDEDEDQDGKDQKKKDKKDKGKNKDSDENDGDKKKKDKKDKGSAGKGIDKKKMPAILKQLMSDDNKLQKKMIDTGTNKRKSREKRDW